MSDHVIQTHQTDRLRVVHLARRVHIYSEYFVGGHWSTDEDAGLSIDREHLPALLAALGAPLNESEEQKR